MRKLYFVLIAMLISFAGFSQGGPAAYGLIVENQTNCPQNYYVLGDELCNCGGAYNSPLITIPPGGVHVYPNSLSVPGFPTSGPKGIFGAKILDGPIGCNASGGVVGQGPCGLPPMYTFKALTSNCASCELTRATWIPANDCKADMARLIFTP